ncbi:MAG: IS630 family transposase [Nitrososphaerales archaeon]
MALPVPPTQTEETVAPALLAKPVELGESVELVEKTSSTLLPIKIFTEDESRFGQMTVLRQRITLKGIKPVASYQHDFENTCLYGAVAPITGESFFFELPRLDSQCFQIFIDQFSEAFPDSLNILTLDNGSFHKAEKLRLPLNVRFVFTPPYTPEVNPMERVWQDFKAQLAGEIFATLDALCDRLASIICSYLPSQLSSLTSYPFFKAVCNAFL